MGLGAVLLLAVGCDDASSPTTVAATYVEADSLGAVHVEFGTEPGRWVGDPLQIDSARVISDVLEVFAMHGGGCEVHEYAAVAWNGWLESNPVQVGVILAHDDHDDPCDALLSPRLRFDLGPLKSEYVASYGAGPAEVVLRLTDVNGVGGAPTSVVYAF